MAKPVAHFTADEERRFCEYSAWRVAPPHGVNREEETMDLLRPGVAGRAPEPVTSRSCGCTGERCIHTMSQSDLSVSTGPGLIRHACPVLNCGNSYAAAQSLLAHVEKQHLGNDPTAVPPSFLHAYQRWVCCGHFITFNKVCRVCKARAPSLQPRSAQPGSTSIRNGEPTGSSTAAPPAMNSQPSAVRPLHICPFPTCAQGSLRGAGWLTPRELFLHLNSVHISCGQFPSVDFLSHFQKEICPTCLIIKPATKPCGAV